MNRRKPLLKLALHNSQVAMDDYNYLFKIILIGDANVGKTCLVRRFAKGYFPPGQIPTIGVDFSIKTVDVDGEKVKVSDANKSRSCLNITRLRLSLVCVSKYIDIFIYSVGYSEPYDRKLFYRDI